MGSIGLLQSATPVFAAPANPEAFELLQPDGTSIHVYAVGDEYAHSIVTGEGYTIVKNTAGFWTYATVNATGHLIAGERRVGLDVPPPLALHLQGTRDERMEPASTHGQGHYRATGTQPVLVLLIQFSDQPPIGSTPADWQRKFFNPADSVAAYYREASQNLLQLVPAAESSGVANDGIVGWLTLPYPHPNTNTIGQEMRNIAQDAVTAADAYVNYASFDTDGSGGLSSSELHIAIIFAGYEGSYSPASKCGNAIWGHRANLSAQTRLDNVVVLNSARDGGYFAVGEWHCTSTNRPGHAATIGPIVHEIGHDLGLPDLYDTDGSTYGVGTWSPMALGSWNSVPGGLLGGSPAHHDAFSRAYMGWVTPTQVSSSQSGLALEPAETTGQVLQFLPNLDDMDWIFRYQSGQGEYYLVENRQRIGYDAGLRGCGLLIWQVNETAPFNNSANADDELRLVNLRQADGRDDLRQRTNIGDGGDPFPGTSGSSTFGRFTKPSSVLYSGAFSGITITNILAASSACPTVQLRASAASLGSVQASTTSNTTLGIGPLVPTSALDLSIRMTAELEGSALPTATPSPTPTATPTATPGPQPILSNRIYLPLLQR